jgi:SP family facilitated glucose transporter-like MFS transporter 1
MPYDLRVLYFQELVAWIWWLSVVSTLFYVVFFAVGPGSIPWMITAELFSQGPRPAAMSVAVLVNWSANFFVGIGFPTMQTTLENYTFLPFSVFLALFWVFTYKKVPETKNKTFDEIATLFRIGHKQRYLITYKHHYLVKLALFSKVGSNTFNVRRPKTLTVLAKVVR